jgi:hypothetical protein
VLLSEALADVIPKLVPLIILDGSTLKSPTVPVGLALDTNIVELVKAAVVDTKAVPAVSVAMPQVAAAVVVRFAATKLYDATLLVTIGRPDLD